MIEKMKMFATALKGKRVLTTEGEELGEIDSVVADIKSGGLEHLLIRPVEAVDARLFKTDSEGRLVLPFSGIKSVKDVVIMELK
ncbi:MAG: PRC-barrel domain-containing protein [Candidatus Thermoplasmatota archaeon]